MHLRKKIVKYMIIFVVIHGYIRVRNVNCFIESVYKVYFVLRNIKCFIKSVYSREIY